MIFVLFWPLIPYFLIIIVVGFWAASAVFLASTGEAQNSAVNKTSYIDNSTGQELVVAWVEDLSSRVPCDPTANDTAGRVCQFMRYGGDE